MAWGTCVRAYDGGGTPAQGRHAGGVLPGRRTAPIALTALTVVAALATGACGGGAPDPDEVTGRVMSKTEQGYCVSPDRGATTHCLPLDRAEDEADVGECVRITDAPTPQDARLTIVDESACAAGDLGDDAPDR